MIRYDFIHRMLKCFGHGFLLSVSAYPLSDCGNRRAYQTAAVFRNQANVPFGTPPHCQAPYIIQKFERIAPDRMRVNGVKGILL